MKQEIARSNEHGNVKLRAQGVPFSAIPHQSKLFLDYLRDPLSLKRYYPNAVDSYTAVSAFVPEVLANFKTDRNALCGALAEMNSHIGSHTGTFNNIDLLCEAKTVAVVTGQQAGLFTGPLYTIYKALSAIKMAEYLNSAGVTAVAVFWIATEDHDFEEVSHVDLIGNSGELIEADYRPGAYVANSPVGTVEIDGPISEVIDTIVAQMPQTEWSAPVREAIERAWSAGTLFGLSFAKELAGMLSRFGLIFVDPMHAKLKELASPVYVDAIEQSDEIVASIRQRSVALEDEGFHAQVLVEEDYFPLFWHDDKGRRVSLRKVARDIYRTKGEKLEFSRAELAATAREHPERFSPGVMLRPVVQDFLFPAACYIGGGAEIAYFAQNSEAYRVLGRPVTPILHRQSFTVVESKHRRSLEKIGLEFTDLFAGFEETLESVGKRQLASETAANFANAEETINAKLDRLDQNLSQLDPTLSANLAKRRRKIGYHLTALKKKAYLAQIRKDETAERQIRAAFTALLPKGQLQERVLNVNSFLNKYGPYFIDWLYEAIDLSDKDHQIIDI